MSPSGIDPGAETRVDGLPGFVPFPPDRASRYREAGLWRDLTLPDAFAGWAASYGARVAVTDGTRTLTYAGLCARVRSTAAGFADLGIVPGDRVVVHLPNIPEFVVALLALLECGAVPVLTLPAHREREITHLARLADARGYVTVDVEACHDHRVLARGLVEAVPTVRTVVVIGDPEEFVAFDALDGTPREFPRAAPESPALLLVSGGTTGLPKLIPRTHVDYEYNARASAELCGLTGADVYLAVLPAAHNFALACPGILGALGVGATIVAARDASPEHAFGLIDEHGVTVTALVPALAQLWCEAVAWEDADLSSLRLLQVGGAALAPEIARTVTPALGCTLQQVFGMAEGLLNYTRLDADPRVCTETQGRPLSALDEIRIVDGDGHDVPDGDAGELLTRGPYTIGGYFRAEEHNRTAFTPDGFYRSGDRVRRSATGDLVVAGRIKDVIVRGGENVVADELEDLLLSHPAVARVAVVGVPHADLGESVCAVVVPRGRPPATADLRGYLLDLGCARTVLPDRVVHRAGLPLTAVGKIDKSALRRTVEAL